jgi:hypothetical protein
MESGHADEVENNEEEIHLIKDLHFNQRCGKVLGAEVHSCRDTGRIPLECKLQLSGVEGHGHGIHGEVLVVG